LKVWWREGNQPQQLIRDGELDNDVAQDAR
jgi:hypothetical protein